MFGMMQLKGVFLFCLISVFGGIHAQSHLDSLWLEWANTENASSDRLTALNGFIFQSSNNYPDSTLRLTFEMEEFAKEVGEDYQVLESYYLRGLNYYYKSVYDSAIFCFNHAAKGYGAMDSPADVAVVQNRLGMTYNAQGDYVRAVEAYQKTLQYGMKQGDSLKMSNAYNNIGLVKLTQGDYTGAREAFRSTLQIDLARGDSTGSGIVLNNIGLTFQREERFDSAIHYLTQAIQWRDAIGRSQLNGKTYSNLSVCKSKLGDEAGAQIAILKSIELLKEVENQGGLATAYYVLGQIHQSAGRFAKAESYCNKGYRIARKHGIKEGEKYNCRCLYEIHSKTGNYKRALKFLERHKELEDSLYSDERIRQLTRLEMQHSLFERQLADSLQHIQELYAVEMENQKALAEERNLLNLSVLGGLSFLALALLFWNRFRYSQRAKATIEKEKDRSENLLLNILPAEIAEELKEKGEADARSFENVSVLFTDFKGFTALSEKLSPKELVNDLNECFSAFDRICGKYRIEKIKTIGDAYMAAAGLPSPNTTHAEDVVRAALEMRDFVEAGKAKKVEAGLPYFEIRIGIHTGPVVAGIVGVKKFQYDIWGDTVNTASRMESSGEVGQVNISEATYELVKDATTPLGMPEFSFTSRGDIEAKGKGKMGMYFVRYK